MGWFADAFRIYDDNKTIKRMEQRQRDELQARETRALERIAAAAERRNEPSAAVEDER